MLKRTFTGALDHGPIRDRIAEGHAELDDFSSSLNGRQRNLTRSVEVGIAASNVGHKTRSLFEDDCQLAPFSGRLTFYFGHVGYRLTPLPTPNEESTT